MVNCISNQLGEIVLTFCGVVPFLCLGPLVLFFPPFRLFFPPELQSNFTSSTPKFVMRLSHLEFDPIVCFGYFIMSHSRLPPESGYSVTSHFPDLLGYLNLLYRSI